MSSLSENEKQKVNCHPVNNTYRFGKGKLFPALQDVDILLILRHKKVVLNTDVVANDIPLLLSGKFIKKADMTLDFEKYNTMILKVMPLCNLY